MIETLVAASLAFVLAPSPQRQTTPLLAPVRLEAGGAPIDADVGHAAPFVGDFDEDGVNDLLVGQFGGGALWICRNEGSNAAPKLGKPVKWKEGKPEGTVPTG
jgi:hypothetical protein